MIWLVAAIFSAVFAGVTSILAKCGIKKTDSDLATALRTIVVLVFSWIMVFVVGSVNTITAIEPKSLIFLILSGLATGASWICYFKALSIGDVNKVVPIDKSSTILTVLLARKKTPFGCSTAIRLRAVNMGIGRIWRSPPMSGLTMPWQP